jgi:hypothetical protein
LHRTDIPAGSGFYNDAAKGVIHLTGLSRPALVVSVCFIVFLVFPVLALEPTWQYSEPGATIGGIALSSNGSLIAVAAEKIWFFEKNGTLISKAAFGNNLAMTPDGSSVVSSYYSSLYLFRISSDRNETVPIKQVWEQDMSRNVVSLGISKDGNTIGLIKEGKGLSVYSSDGTLLGYNDSYYPVMGISADGRFVDGISQDGLTTFIKSGREVNRSVSLSLATQPKMMVLSSKGDTCVFNEDQDIHLLRISNGSDIWKARATGDVTSLAMTPGGSAVIVGTDNGHIEMFNGKGNRTWTYNTAPQMKNYADVPSVAVSSDGAYIAAGTSGGQILMLNSGGVLQWTNKTNDHIHHVAISADGVVTIATGEETVYAFTTQSHDISQTTASYPSQTSLESPQSGSDDSYSPPSESSDVPSSATTSPQQYSVIITPSKSPLPPFNCLIVLFILVVFLKRH